MYLAGKAENDVSGLFLNDIGLNLTWMSIYGLYEGMKTAVHLPKAETLASLLGVTEGAVRDVQSPHHFDLPHHKDWKGMKFGHVLNNFKGPVFLIYGSESGVCLPQQVEELQAKFPRFVAMRVEGATHPVPFSASVCAFVLGGLKLDPMPAHIQVTSDGGAFDNNLTPVKKTEFENNNGSRSNSDWRSRFAKWLTRYKQSESK